MAKRSTGFKLVPLIVLLNAIGIQGGAVAATLVDFQSSWRYFKGYSEASNPASNWRNVGFSDAGWNLSATPLRHDAGSGGTLLPDMAGGYSCVFMRQTFSITDKTLINSLTLNVNYDAGFVAWINGTEVARGNAPVAVNFNSVAPGPHASGIAEEFSFSTAALSNGTNVLAIQAFSSDLNAATFQINARLESETGDTVPAPQFSIPRGFCSAPIQLELAASTAGATINYTLDGTAPSSTVGTAYTGSIPINRTSVVRAIAFKTGMVASRVESHSYLFIDDIIHQSLNHETPTPGTWPSQGSVNGQVIDYGMDTRIVDQSPWKETIKDDLKSLPTISLVMKTADLFNSSTGIYANPGGNGAAWERPCSVELIDPSGDAAKQFQINCGVRIRGGFSRSGGNPKHAIRFLISESEYGDAELNYKLIADKPTTKFRKFDLRTFANYSWAFTAESRTVFIRDVFSRDSQGALGQPNEGGDFFYLYINGQFWGVYNTDERAEANFGATYFGGDDDDYDCIKADSSGSHQAQPTDGNNAAYGRLLSGTLAGVAPNAQYFKLQGKNPDGTINPDYELLLDPDNVIDYMLVIYYGGNLDAPVLSNGSACNNFYTVRSRKGFMGFKFMSHDAEHTLLDINHDRVNQSVVGDQLHYFNPQWLFQRLCDNVEFKILLADHVQKHFYNGGVFTPQACLDRFNRRTDQVVRSTVPESARWGDSKRNPPFTYNDWVNACNTVRNNIFPNRTQVVINQLRNRGWLTSVLGPGFSKYGGEVSPGFALTITNPNAGGLIYYTTDGTDPRLIGGVASPNAQSIANNATVSIATTTTVKARVLYNGNWSGVQENTFLTAQDFTKLKITEIMYHPAPTSSADVDNDWREFVELKNTGDVPLNLTGVQFSAGITYTFPSGSVIAAHGFKVVASHAGMFVAKYPSVQPEGRYVGNLTNSGERVTLSFGTTTICSVKYDDKTPWPRLADGIGFSLVPVDPDLNGDPDDSTSWRASTNVGGSPGADDPAAPSFVPVVISEVLANSTQPQTDYIELRNPSNIPAEIGGWYLTDSSSNPKKYRIPDGTTLQPGTLRTFDETHFNTTPGVDPSFSLSSLGDGAYLYSADAAGNLTGYAHGIDFGGSEDGIPLGEYLISTGETQYPPLVSRTPDAPNSGPKFGPVVISEIMYAPGAAAPEFVELKNMSYQAIPMFDPDNPQNMWKLSGIDFEFPAGVVIPARGVIMLTDIDELAFRTQFSIKAEIPIFTYSGKLDDDGELLELLRPDGVIYDDNGMPDVPYVVVDAVRYYAEFPWPAGASGTGYSIERVSALQYGNDPINWQRSILPGGSPGVLPPRSKATFSAAQYAVSESESAAQVIVQLDVADEEPVTIHYATTSGSAKASEYQSVSGDLVFQPGETVRGFSVPITAANLLDQLDRTVNLKITAGEPSQLGAITSAVLTIQDDDLPPLLVAGASSASERFGIGSLEVHLEAPSAKTITVDYRTVSGSALGGKDFFFRSGTLTFNPGETSKNIALSIINDTEVDFDETFNVEFFNGTNIGEPLPVAVITIDNDDISPTVTISGRVTLGPGPLAGVIVTDGSRAGTTDAAGSYTILNVPNLTTYTLTAFSPDYTFEPPTRTVTLTGRPVTGQDFSATFINKVPVITSGPSAAPNPAAIGQPVQFSCGAADDEALTYAWNFGDGESQTVSTQTVTHAYATAGIFTASVLVSDPLGLTVARAVSIEIRPLDEILDTDNDSYTDARERILGTNPNNNNSKPGGSADFDGDGSKDDLDSDDDGDLMTEAEEYAAGTDPYNAQSSNASAITAAKAGGSLKPGFGRDAFSATGAISNLKPFANANNQIVVVSLGGAEVSFILDSKGKGTSIQGALALSFNPKLSKSGGFTGGSVKFSAKCKNGTWGNVWADEGVNLNETVSKKPVTFRLLLRMNGDIYAAILHCSCTSKAGKSAAFK